MYSECKNKLRELRERSGKSGIEIANHLGISPQYYYDLETGRGNKRLNEDLLIKLADVFGVSIDYLLGREPDGVKEESVDYLLERENLELANRISRLPDKEKKALKIFLDMAERGHKGDGEQAAAGE